MPMCLLHPDPVHLSCLLPQNAEHVSHTPHDFNTQTEITTPCSAAVANVVLNLVSHSLLHLS